MSNRQKTTVAIAGSLLATMGGQGALAISGPLTARLLGVVGRGQLAVVVLYAGIAALLGGLGLPSAVAYYLAQGRTTTRVALARFWPQWIALCTGAGVACAAATTAYFTWITPRQHGVVVIGLLGWTLVLLMMTQQLTVGCFQGEMRFGALNALRSLPALLTATAIGVAFVTVRPHGVTDLLVLSVAAYGLSTLLSCLVLMRPTSQVATMPSFSGRQLVRYSLSGLIASSNPIDGLSLDQAFVGLLLTPRLLGLYVVASAFDSLGLLALQSIGLIALPRVAAAVPGPSRRREMRLVIAGSALLGVVTALAVEVVLRPVLIFAFGDAFSGAITSARILAFGGLFLGLRRVLISLLQAVGAPGKASLGEAIGVLALMSGLAPLIVTLHDVGASLAVSLAAAVSCASMLLSLHRIDGTSRRRPTRRRPSWWSTSSVVRRPTMIERV